MIDVSKSDPLFMIVSHALRISNKSALPTLSFIIECSHNAEIVDRWYWRSNDVWYKLILFNL